MAEVLYLEVLVQDAACWQQGGWLGAAALCPGACTQSQLLD